MAPTPPIPRVGFVYSNISLSENHLYLQNAFFFFFFPSKFCCLLSFERHNITPDKSKPEYISPNIIKLNSEMKNQNRIRRILFVVFGILFSKCVFTVIVSRCLLLCDFRITKQFITLVWKKVNFIVILLVRWDFEIVCKVIMTRNGKK